MQKSLKISNIDKIYHYFTQVVIPKDKAQKLIKIYMYVRSKYDETLNCYCQRYSNNSKPLFSDQEILTIYLFDGSEQRYTRIKGIHSFAKEYLLDWFPGLVSYQTIVYRPNRMVGAVQELLKHLVKSYKPADCDENLVIVDSMPIMTCCGRNRQGRVARDIADKGFALQRICITMDSSFTVSDIEGKGIFLSLAILFCPRHRRMTSLYSSEIALPNSSENRYMPIKSIRTAFSGNRRRIRVICYSPQ